MQIDTLLSSLNDVFKLDSKLKSEQPDAAPRGNDSVAIESAFDDKSDRDWCELVRDITALANSGGGQIRIGALVDEDQIHRKLAEATDSDFADVSIASLEQSGGSITVITVGPAHFPIAVSKAAVCDLSAAAAGSDDVYQAGTFYFRHGEKTEPGTTADMRAFFERLVRRVSRRWLRGIRRVLSAPIGSVVGATPKQQAAKRKKRDLANLQPVRIVTDPEAPALQPQDVDRLYPWRQKDLLRELNARLGRRALNSYDIQAVRRQHQLDQRPDFVFNLPGAGRRYSPAVADWMMEQFGRDPEFFKQARAADHEIMKLRRQKPR
jgi:hypothetical protein